MYNIWHWGCLNMMFSVIVPIYNVEKYLPQCIESVLSQTFKDFELLLIDDGSPDNSGVICDDYAKKDNRIKVIHKKNEGVSVARNKGMEVATGKYIWFLDSDDFMVNSAMKSIMDFIENQHDADMITCAHYNNFSDGKLEIKYLPYPTSDKCMNRHNYYRNLYMSSGAYWAPWKNIYKKEIIDNNNLSFAADVTCAEDCDFFMRFVECANNYAFFNEPVVHYRTNREGSVTNVMSRKAIEDRLNVYAKYYQKFCCNKAFDISYKMQVFFANKYANGVSELYRLNNAVDKDSLNNLIKSHDNILNDTKGFKYSIAKFIWSIFGYYNGSKVIRLINPKSQ